MNVYTLQFQNKQLEQQFSEHLVEDQQGRIMQFSLFTAAFCLLSGSNELVKGHNNVGIILMIWMISLLAVYLILRNYTISSKLYYPILTISGFVLPYASYYLIILNEELTAQDKVVFLMINSHAVQNLMVYQNFIVSAVIHCNLLAMTCVALTTIFELSIYNVSFTGYALFWLTSEYKNQLNRRELFQGSKVNQSLWSIINESISDKFLTFTYDQDSQKFTPEIINAAAQKYLETNSLSQILKNIYIKTQFHVVNLGQYISTKYLNKGHDLHIDQQNLKGYYNSCSNKLKLQLEVQQIPKQKFLINIIPQIKKQHITSNQSTLIINYEIYTLSIINKIGQTIQCFKQQSDCLNRIKYLLNTYHAKLKILTIQYQDDYKFSIMNFDVTSQLNTLLSNQFIEYQFTAHPTIISTDLSLTKLLFQLILRYLIYLQAIKFKITLETTQDNQCIDFHIEFIVLSKISEIKQSRRDKIIKCIFRIVEMIGIGQTFTSTEFSLRFMLLQSLEPNFTQIQLV